jgi:hypothetical protein
MAARRPTTITRPRMATVRPAKASTRRSKTPVRRRKSKCERTQTTCERTMVAARRPKPRVVGPFRSRDGENWSVRAPRPRRVEERPSVNREKYFRRYGSVDCALGEDVARNFSDCRSRAAAAVRRRR